MQICSLSHLTFEVASPALLDACRDFYVAFGFAVARVMPDSSVLVVYFFDSAALPISVLLKLSASSTTTTTTSIPAALDASSVPLCTFTVADLAPLAAVCSSMNLCHLLLPAPATATTTATTAADPLLLLLLLLRDPCGRVIAFSTSMTPAGVSSPNPNPNPNAPLAPLPCPRASPRAAIASASTTSRVCDALSNLDMRSAKSIPAREPTRRIAILTSGGDSQGMNAAVRAVVRKAIVENMAPYAVRNGYQGLVDNDIKPVTWMQVNRLLGSGGTMLGTARCKDFRTEEGRQRAVLNLVRSGIDALVVIGGDGSLTGADMLRHNWPTFLDRLVAAGDISREQKTKHQHLNIVGLVGSIDNDMSLTDMTIGCASALHRICEAVDAICATALSHSRAFVVEVMGRHCGWLAAMAAIATGADYLFVPERPPPDEDWESEMCRRLGALRADGQQKIIVIVSEGAIDKHLKPIKPEYVRDILASRLGFDARVTTLGHIQRGGSTCFYDRFIATVQGVRAVEEIMSATPDTKSPMIGVSNNEITVVPLVDAVSRTKEVSAAIEKKDFARAMDLRDPEFEPAYEAFVAMSAMRSSASIPCATSTSSASLNIGIIHIGAPAGGVNAATRAATMLAVSRGHRVFGINNGFQGLACGDVHELTRDEVLEWTALGGSMLGTTRVQPDNLGLCALQLQRFGINSLLLIGGFEAYTALNTLRGARNQYPALCIPMVLIPATISNNVPGTDYSLGSDTALNFIVYACDTIKQSASASRKRVFVVEVQGGNVGYLATLGGIAGGASAAYIPETGINIDMIQRDVALLKRRYHRENALGHTSKGRVLLRSEAVSSTYTTEMLASVLTAESDGLFDARTAVLGHMQQGASPSPLDRIRGSRLAALCVEWFETHATADTNAALSPGTIYNASDAAVSVIGIRGASIVFTPVSALHAETDHEGRRATKSWWLPLSELIPMLSVCPEGYVPPSEMFSARSGSSSLKPYSPQN